MLQEEVQAAMKSILNHKVNVSMDIYLMKLVLNISKETQTCSTLINPRNAN